MAISSKQPKSDPKRAFSIYPAIIAFAFLEALFTAQAVFAYKDRFFTVSQMQGRGISQGLPFAWHFAMWGDLALISGLTAYLVGRYWSRWPRRRILASLALGAFSAAAMNWLYTFSAIPEAHVQFHRLTTAGFLHLVYMAAALSVFYQFLVFTENVPVRTLRIVSAMLFVHVIIGTHMLLGLWTYVHPLDWYPAQPLTSIFGWLTVATVGAGLACRNFLTISKIVALGYVPLNLAFTIFEFVSGQNPRTAEGYLKFLDFFCGIALASTFYLKKVISLESQTTQDQVPLILLSMIAIKYLLGRMSVTQELAIGKSLFPPERVPDDLKLGDRVKITIQVTGFMALYMVLGIFVDQILIVSGIMTVLAYGDFRTRDLINENIRTRFADRNFAPRPKAKEYKEIMARRTIAEWYLFSLPHLCKELWVVFGSATAFAVAAYGRFGETDLTLPAYFILIGVHFINEVITVWWRIDRYVRLKAVNR